MTAPTAMLPSRSRPTGPVAKLMAPPRVTLPLHTTCPVTGDAQVIAMGGMKPQITLVSHWIEGYKDVEDSLNHG